MRILTLIASLLIYVELSAQSSPVALSLFFDKGEAGLSAGNTMKLQEFIDYLKDSSFNSVFIKGYADIDGSEESNLALSQQRAEAITWMINNSRYTVESKYYGEKQSINKSRNEEEKSMNRRVDVIFWTNYQWGKNKKKPQVFTFASNKNIEFTAAEGTKIKIPANSLVYADGKPVQGEIQIEITEFYSMADIIQNKLTTSSNGELIISDGMININASRNTNELRLKGGATMDVGFASREENDGFELFYGSQNARTDVVNWIPAANPTFIDKVWTISGAKLFMDDTIETYKSKFEFNKYGQRIKVTEKWEETKGISYDTMMIDKTINANKIILQSTQLGWINCDQFYFKEESPSVDLFVDIEGSISPNIVLIFNDKKAMIAPTINKKGQLIFANIPAGEKVTITGVGSGDGKLYFAKQETITSASALKLNFEESTIANIEDKLAGFN